MVGAKVTVSRVSVPAGSGVNNASCRTEIWLKDQLVLPFDERQIDFLLTRRQVRVT